MKTLFFSILTLLIGFFCTNCYAEIAPDIQKIMTSGKLVVAIPNQDFPPFFFHNSKNEYEGFDIDIATEIANYLGVKLEINATATSFNDVIGQVEDDKADIGLGELSATIPRALHVAFSKPYLKENKVLIINRVLDLKVESNDGSIKQDSLKFGVIKNSAYESFLKDKFYSISKYATSNGVVPYDSIENAMNNLMEGKLYAVFIDEIKANYLLKNLRSANIYTKKLIIDGQTDPISIAVNSKHQTLLNWINLFIEEIDYNGEKNTLSQKYFKGLK